MGMAQAHAVRTALHVAAERVAGVRTAMMQLWCPIL
jgi:hypothetical protein